MVDKLCIECKKIFCIITGMQIPALRQPFVDVFLTKNAELNLSAIRDAEGVFVKHVQDALEINKKVTFVSGQSVIDVGTGGGIPLLPLAISNPHVQFTGLDSVRKKTEAVADMAKQL